MKSDTMNIHSTHGTKIRFVRPTSGFPLKTVKTLVKNAIYTVQSTMVYKQHTDVILVEFPNDRFGSCHFDDVSLLDPYVKLEQNGLTALFVNSWEVSPSREIPLPFYRYAIVESFGNANSYVFYRLHYIVWTMEVPANDPDIEPYFNDYQVLDWKEVEVKPHCVAGMIQLVDSMVGAEEFLELKSIQ